MFSDSPELFPDFEWGEVHVLAADSHEWRNELLQTLTSAAPVCALGSGKTIDNLSATQQPQPRMHGLKLVELKHQKRPQLQAFLQALSAVTRHAPILYVELDSLAPTLFSELMFQQQGLLSLRNWAREQQKLVIIVAQGELSEYPLSQWIVGASSMANSLSLIFRGEHFWHWDIEHWYTERDVLMRNLIIDDSDPDRPRLTQHQAIARDYIEPLVQADAVWYTHKSILPSDGVPAKWQPLHHLEDWQNEVPENSPGSILLGIKASDSVIALAHIVHEMRVFFGESIRIFIREIAKPVRHEDENLLLRAGATMIIPYELKLGRILVLIDNTAGWRFTRPILPNLERILADYERERLQGYLPPQSFMKEVLKNTKYAGAHGIHCALIRGVPMDGLDLVQITAQCQNRREGDVMTIADGALYIYLFACRESDVDSVLKFLLGLPSASLFEREVRYCSPHVIVQALDTLAQRLEQYPERDHTEAIAARRQQTVVPETSRKRASPVGSAPPPPKPASWRRP